MRVGAWSSDAIGRRWSIIGASVATIVFGYIYAHFNAASDPTVVLSVGFVLIVAIYVQTAILFGVYTPELFPTEIRLTANGICNTLGRAATVASPFVVVYLMAHYKLPGVVWLMIGSAGGPDRRGLGLGRGDAQPRAGGRRRRAGVTSFLSFRDAALAAGPESRAASSEDGALDSGFARFTRAPE